FLVERRVNEGFPTFFDSLWWTIVTISTVGYGERVPLTFWGRIGALATIFVGMAVMGTVTGRIASFLMERQMKEENGALDYHRLKGHFVVCGWKREMNRVLHQILDADECFSPVSTVLLNRAPTESITDIRNDPRLKGIRYVNGDLMEERDLIRAGIKGATRVLVLADHLTEGDLRQIDSKTVMAVMSIKNLNKNAYVCAELLDTKYEKYLRLSHCDEILSSREFVRAVTACAASGTGLSHVLQALISGTNGGCLETVKIPDSFIGKTYAALREYFFYEEHRQLIGLLENTGNIMARKREALRDAQKNPDISSLVPKLKEVKSLTANEPVINPPADYMIRRYTRGIVITGPEKGSAR
ncbi:MAG: transporter, partial [Chitinivibrionales bacterium]|nr:transporter [Chitinivibrionales bacterium]MBD3356058.1 transporter [Chitinivibrionales bacterium]